MYGCRTYGVHSNSFPLLWTSHEVSNDATHFPTKHFYCYIKDAQMEISGTIKDFKLKTSETNQSLEQIKKTYRRTTLRFSCSSWTKMSNRTDQLARIDRTYRAVVSSDTISYRNKSTVSIYIFYGKHTLQIYIQVQLLCKQILAFVGRVCILFTIFSWMTRCTFTAVS